MVLFIGDDLIYNFIEDLTDGITRDERIENAEKLIVSAYSDEAITAIKAALLINIPVLGLSDGFKAVSEAFSVRYEQIETGGEGKMEMVILDNSSLLFKDLQKVIRACRGTSHSLIEASMPKELSVTARAETGEVIAFSAYTTPEIETNVFAVNLHIESALTPDGEKIVKNFLNLER
ncbi:MAG: hypothetical protein Q4B31_00535 [Clostridia bacterium]|nr:hypothetical protein [Clostridia bacterium]